MRCLSFLAALLVGLAVGPGCADSSGASPHVTVDGEFRSAFVTVRGDTLVVQDPRSARATTFNWRTGQLLATRFTVCCAFGRIAMDSAGRVYAPSIAQAHDTSWTNVQAFARFGVASDAVDTLFAREQQVQVSPQWLVREGDFVRMSTVPPYQPRAHFAVDPTGALVTGWSGVYSLRVSSNGTDTVALFGRTHEPAPVTRADKNRLVEERIASMRAGNPNAWSEAILRAAFDPGLIPDMRPAYEAFSVDAAGRRWVRLADVDSAVVTMDLYDREGRWLDIVRVDGPLWPRSVWDAVAWSRTQVAVLGESEDGRPLVRIFDIVRR